MFRFVEWFDWKWIKGLREGYIVKQLKNLRVVKIIEWVNIELLKKGVEFINWNNYSIKKFLGVDK